MENNIWEKAEKRVKKNIEKQNKKHEKCLHCGLYLDETREATCPCCGQPFQAKHKRRLSIFIIEPCSWEKYCDKCQKQIKATDWFGHHRKEPTPKLLEAEIRRLL